MSDATDIAVSDADPVEKPRRGGGLVFGLIAAIALGGAGFYSVWSGMLDPILGKSEAKPSKAASSLSEVTFVPLDPVVVTLPPTARAKLLRFTGQLEVEPDYADEIAHLMPRIIDVLNTYLRAVDVRDLEAPSAATRLRAQMLRRVQVVTGEGRVRDLLVTEFVMN